MKEEAGDLYFEAAEEEMKSQVRKIEKKSFPKLTVEETAVYCLLSAFYCLLPPCY
jgi:hypothetical protein